MPDGGVLGVYVHEATDWTRQLRGTAISIVDTGAGIRPEDLRRLFQPFFSTKAAKGTGLGLWISKGIIQKYDGRISCRSLRHNAHCATCFRIFLPVSGLANASPGAIAESNGQERESARQSERESPREAPPETQPVSRSRTMLQAIS
jgi:hypothetical protein